MLHIRRSAGHFANEIIRSNWNEPDESRIAFVIVIVSNLVKGGMALSSIRQAGASSNLQLQ